MVIEQFPLKKRPLPTGFRKFVEEQIDPYRAVVRSGIKPGATDAEADEIIADTQKRPKPLQLGATVGDRPHTSRLRF